MGQFVELLHRVDKTDLVVSGKIVLVVIMRFQLITEILLPLHRISNQFLSLFPQMLNFQAIGLLCS